MCQLDWVVGCPDIWLNVISGCGVRVFLKEISSESGDLEQQFAPPVGAGTVNPLRALVEGEFDLSSLMACAGISVFSCPWCSWFSDLRTRTELHRGLSRLSPACLWQILGLLGLHNGMSQFLIRNLFLCIYPVGLVSLENSD